jgi:hypothetical protein
MQNTNSKVSCSKKLKKTITETFEEDTRNKTNK